jgi:carbamoyl-phosphate synthase large subunit
LLVELGIPQPPNGTATSNEEARDAAAEIGYPVLVRPSYVLGGRAMQIVYDEATLDNYMTFAVEASPEHPVLIDSFLEDAVEIDVDALADGERVVIAGIQQHIEEAGIHSGDSSCVLPPWGIKDEYLDSMRRYTRELAKALNVIGLMNIQFAIWRDTVYVLEVNPRASRTVPFVSKATGVPLAKIAARLMVGRKLSEFNLPDELQVDRFYVKSPVFPFAKFPGVDPVLGPEMRSTGEVMGVSEGFGSAYLKAQQGAGTKLPREGTVFISVNDQDKRAVLELARELHEMGFKLVATRGTQKKLEAEGVPCGFVYKVNEGRPNIADLVKSKEVHLIINTPLGRTSFYDERSIRRAAIQYSAPCVTTMTGAVATVAAIRALREEELQVRSLQDYHAQAASK